MERTKRMFAVSAATLILFATAVTYGQSRGTQVGSVPTASKPATHTPLPPRTGGTLVLSNRETTFAVFGLWDIWLDQDLFGLGVLDNGTDAVYELDNASTERGLVRYNFVVCSDIAGMYNIDSLLYMDDGALSATTCIPGTQCTFLGIPGSGMPGVSIDCFELECKASIPAGTVLPDTVHLNLFTNVASNPAPPFDGVFSLIPANTPAFAGEPIDECTVGLCYDGIAISTINGGSPPVTGYCAGVWDLCCVGFVDPNLRFSSDVQIYADNVGACCNGPACQIITEAQCLAGGGTYVGDFTDCADFIDGDGVAFNCDNCPLVSNPGQEDCNSDGQGDACDPDAGEGDGDGDGYCDGVDNCPMNANPGQEDADMDGVGDACDPCTGFPNVDADGDGICDSSDPCLGASNMDTDGDGLCDEEDPCPNDAPPDDDDGDGVCDFDDACPGFDDNVDTDGDGVADGCDDCPLDAPPDDDDGDGVCDSDDVCAGGDDNVDSDGDGVPDFCDHCPGKDDTIDADMNGVPDCLEGIPTVSTWGLVVLALLLVTAWKVYFGRPRTVEA